MPKISVVILSWNGEKFLQRFLPSVVANTDDQQAEIVVADNGSTDGSVAYVAQHFPQVRLIKFDRNFGFTGGYNRAMAQVKSTYTVLLNSDVNVPPGWLTPLVQRMDAYERVGACMPKIRSFSQPQCFEYAGGAGGFIDMLGYPFCRGRILSTIEQDRGQYNDSRKIFWATGACMMVRTKLFKMLGGFDSDFFAHMEEIDLCWRMQNAGYDIVCVGASEVFHVGGGTLPNNNPRKLFYNYRNNLLMLYKNLPSGVHVAVVALRMLLDWGSAVVFLLQLKFSYAKAVFKAHAAFFKLKRGKRNSRRSVFSVAGAGNLSGVYRGSIVLSYFLFGKRTFGALRTLKP
ncbi:MAG: glycosyltransferase family 2 protein [Prevotellaceae bacterium]|jgi:GT2 family glycosyltransferase|nr:glycosyltransferase family 2 protein [Prevotellaceae bacterium]